MVVTASENSVKIQTDDVHVTIKPDDRGRLVIRKDSTGELRVVPSCTNVVVIF